MSALPRDTDPLDADDDDACRIGLVHGLSARTDLNGRLARAVRWVQSKQRWALIMDGGEKVLVRDENIDFQAPEAVLADAAPLNAEPVATGCCVGSPVVGQCVDSSELERSVAKGAAVAPAAVAVLATAPPPVPPFEAWLRGVASCLCLPVLPPRELAAPADHPKVAPVA